MEESTPTLDDRGAEIGGCDAAEYASDGLSDLLLAGLFLIFGVEEMLIHEVGAFLPLALVALVGGFFIAKHYVTQRRVGVPPLRERALRCAAVVSTAIGTLGGMVVLLMLADPGEVEPAFGGAVVNAWIVGGSVAVAFGVLALALEQRRFWLYAVLFGLPLPLTIMAHVYGWVSLPPIVPFGILPVAATVIGVRRLRTFLAEHPVRPERLRSGITA